MASGVLRGHQRRYLKRGSADGIDDAESLAGPQILLRPGHQVRSRWAQPLEIGRDKVAGYYLAPKGAEFAGAVGSLKTEFRANR